MHNLGNEKSSRKSYSSFWRMNLEFRGHKLVIGTDTVLFQYQLVNIHSFLSYLKHYPYIFICSWFCSGTLSPTKLLANLCVSTAQLFFLLFCFVFFSPASHLGQYFSNSSNATVSLACLYHRFLDHRLNVPRVSGLYWPAWSWLLFSQEGKA